MRPADVLRRIPPKFPPPIISADDPGCLWIFSQSHMGNIGRDAMAMAAEEDRWPARPGEGDGARYPPPSAVLFFKLTDADKLDAGGGVGRTEGKVKTVPAERVQTNIQLKYADRKLNDGITKQRQQARKQMLTVINHMTDEQLRQERIFIITAPTGIGKTLSLWNALGRTNRGNCGTRESFVWIMTFCVNFRSSIRGMLRTFLSSWKMKRLIWRTNIGD